MELSRNQLLYLSRETGLNVTRVYTKGPEVWVDWGRGPKKVSTYMGTYRIKLLVMRDLPTLAFLIKYREGIERDRELSGLAARRPILSEAQ